MTRFKTCCEKGYKAAIKLAAFCSGKSEAVVEASYKKWCKDDGQFDASGMDMAPDEIMELLEAHESVNDADENECHEVLTCLQRESVFVDPEAEENTVPNDNVELAFEKVKGKEDLVFLLQSAGDPEDADMGTFQKKQPVEAEITCHTLFSKPWSALGIGSMLCGGWQCMCAAGLVELIQNGLPTIKRPVWLPLH